MGLSKLSITYKNKTDHYTLNNELDDHVLDGIIENILKHYPKDATIDIVDGIYKINTQDLSLIHISEPTRPY